MSVERLGVVGAGTMGSGIAQISALGGIETFLHDPVADALGHGLESLRQGLAKGSERGRWTEAEAEAANERALAAPGLGDLAGCDLVIEAAPEDLALKRELFSSLAEICAEATILATNTSSLSVTAIAAGVPDPGRVVGMHFFNPPPLMRLLEIVAGEETRPEVLAIARDVGERMGRTPIDAADGIGFLANRLVRPYSLESLRMLGERTATVAEIDMACRVHAGFRMGPFELMDLVGIDIGFAVARSFWEQSFHEPRWQPHPIQQRMVDSGRLGRKTGRGFYDYRDGPHRSDDPRRPDNATDVAELIDGGDPAGEILGRILSQIVNEAHFAIAAGVGSREDADTAMRLGFNWPCGPFEWGERIGLDRVLGVLDGLWESRREERYRVAPLLREQAGSRHA